MMAGRGRRGTAVIIVALLALASCAESGPSAAIRYAPPPAVPGATIPTGTTPCIVDRVSDGDTLVCSSGTVVRLILVDTPEMSQTPFGDQARTVLLALAPAGSVLAMEFDAELIDPFGRTLAYLWRTDGRIVNEELLRLGVAVLAVYPPNQRYEERFRAVALDAETRDVGFWATGGFACLPAAHRAGDC